MVWFSITGMSIEKMERPPINRQVQAWAEDYMRQSEGGETVGSPETGAEKYPSRNLLSRFRETASAMADVEGRHWAAYQAEERGYTLAAALKVLAEVQDRLKSETDSEAVAQLIAHGGTTVYGDGGGNRWVVRDDGAVEFAEHNAVYPSEKTVEKVRRAGFQVF